MSLSQNPISQVRVISLLPVCVLNLQSDGEMVTDTNPHLASCCELLELVLRKGLQRQYPHNMCASFEETPHLYIFVKMQCYLPMYSIIAENKLQYCNLHTLHQQLRILSCQFMFQMIVIVENATLCGRICCILNKLIRATMINCNL